MKLNHWWLKTKMAAKIASVGGIETGFRHITNSIWGREKCNTCFYPKKSQAINIWPFYTDDINSSWLKTQDGRQDSCFTITCFIFIMYVCISEAVCEWYNMTHEIKIFILLQMEMFLKNLCIKHKYNFFVFISKKG